ncbi:hypothetical protein KCP69_01815 [Salmonella enterica subsp. enterica]|nr:hypothetical protein KCP69_01815 [Salmonella enterica subsp. enterica]
MKAAWDRNRESRAGGGKDFNVEFYGSTNLPEGGTNLFTTDAEKQAKTFADFNFGIGAAKLTVGANEHIQKRTCLLLEL